ncbi:hypothetical protein VNO77_23817 [Canavalia gladiata]|uniref:SIAH-type domain-containing protein n=1 Tax=Canavalia gladiata TaxID=3824 RepID=A0AAN9Q9A6_CANGL
MAKSDQRKEEEKKREKGKHEFKNFYEEDIQSLNNNYYDYGYDYNCNNDEENVVEEEDEHDDEGISSIPKSNVNGEDLNSYATDASSDRFITVRLSNPNVFDCCVCSQQLTIPVFECGNGHAACSTCSADYETICRICFSPIGTYRCAAIENVLECIEKPCQNVNYGCPEILNYNERNEHDNECIYAPCFCPYPACNFAAPSNDLYFHFSHKHVDVAVPFSYDEFVTVFLWPSCFDPIALQEKSDSTLFILNSNVENLGCVVSLSCFAPNCSQLRYHYSMCVSSNNKGCGLMLHDLANNIQSCTAGNPSSGFLVIPFDYFGYSEPLRLQICIKDKCDPIYSAE